eukprot:6206305-Pleurochrysis_carterae.AAC.1
MSLGTDPLDSERSRACDAVQLCLRRRLDGNGGERPSSPAAQSATRSLRTAIDGTADRPEPGRARSNDDGPYRLNGILPFTLFSAEDDSNRFHWSWVPL